MTTCMRIRGLARTLAVLALMFAVAVAGQAAAKDKKDKDSEWKVKGFVVGRAKSTDVSGIACATDKGFPRTCVLIDDDLQAAQVVTVEDGKIRTEGERMIPLIDNRFRNAPVELDGEGVAFADGYFYVIGSHGRPRSEDADADEVKARVDASSKVIRFKLNADETAAHDLAVSTKLARLIAQTPLFDASRDKALEDGGLTIEGVAVIGGRLYAGFRGPVVDEQAIILSASLGHLFGNEPAGNEPPVALTLGGGRGVRDLAAYNGGLFVLAGPVNSDEGDYSVLWWNTRDKEVVHLVDLPAYYKKTVKKSGKVKKEQVKPEALLPLDRDGKEVRLLILMDSAKEGEPHEVRVPYPG